MIKYNYLAIIKNRDNKGNILTYTVIDENGYKWEVNTLKEAKFHAIIVNSGKYIESKSIKRILGKNY